MANGAPTSNTDNLDHALPQSSPPAAGGYKPSKTLIISLASILTFVVFAFIFTFEPPTYPSTPTDTTQLPPLLIDRPTEPLPLDESPTVSDFTDRLDLLATRLTKLEQSLVLMTKQLTSATPTVSDDMLSKLNDRLTKIEENLVATQRNISANSEAITALRTVIESLQAEATPIERTHIVADLKLLSVSIWDDGLVGLISLGEKNTAVSVGDFITGLKVEELSVENQTITFYELATNKRFMLYANSIVYKEK